MKYRVTHKTTYQGDQPVSVCHNEAWLKPRDTPFQCLEDHQLAAHPSPTVWLIAAITSATTCGRSRSTGVTTQ